MKRNRIILISAVLLVLAGVIWFNTVGKQRPVTVVGNVPAKDIAQIERVVRHDFRQRIFPDISWQSLKHLPNNIKNNWPYKFDTILAYGDGKVTVTVKCPSPIKGVGWEWVYHLANGPGGWTITSSYLNRGPKHP